MLDLASINTYLREIDSRIGSYQMQIYEKEEQLSKLDEALMDLGNNKRDFIEKKEICIDPEFSRKTFHGENSNDIHEFRDGVMQVNFQSIPERQISDAQDAMIEKIKEIAEEIQSIQGDIETQESRREHYLAQKREVESES